MSITAEQAFTRWTEAAGPWSKWIKPSLFAPHVFVNDEANEELPYVGFLPPPNDTGLVLDLAAPGVVRMGVALNQLGYCPVPMFNTTSGSKEVFPARQLADTLLRESSRLRAVASGPPVFLLDVRRELVFGDTEAGDYDNQWRVFSSDFPTHAALRANGIRKLFVVCEKLKQDLHDALARHPVLDLELFDPKTERRTPFPRPRWIAFRALTTLTGAYPRADGSFGRIVSTGG